MTVLPTAETHCGPASAAISASTRSVSIVNGAVRVRDGRLVDVDVPALVERHRRAALALVDG